MNLRLGPHTITVLTGPDVNVALADDDAYGDSDVGRGTIRARDDVTPAIFIDTIIHEALHHIWALTPCAQQFTSEQEETVIRALTPWLQELGFLRTIKPPVSSQDGA